MANTPWARASCCWTGAVPPVNLGILSAKGSLYVTRPTLATYIASREELVERSNALFDVVKSGKVKIETTARYKLADAAKAHSAARSDRKCCTRLCLPAAVCPNTNKL